MTGTPSSEHKPPSNGDPAALHHRCGVSCIAATFTMRSCNRIKTALSFVCCAISAFDLAGAARWHPRHSALVPTPHPWNAIELNTYLF
jgi:hypothetical protein